MYNAEPMFLRYLTENSPGVWDGIGKAESHDEVAVTCLSYLRFRYFDSDITDDEVDGFIDQGGYALHHYSQSNFLHHIRGACCDTGGASQILRTSTGEFLKERWNPYFRHVEHSSSTLGHIESMDPENHRKFNVIAAHLRARNLTESTNGLFFLSTRFVDYSRVCMLTSSRMQTCTKSRCF